MTEVKSWTISGVSIFLLWVPGYVMGYVFAVVRLGFIVGTASIESDEE